ncbi:MAG: redox-sensing transcriptional repressor Rex [Candidatus Poribacteria bacterium]|nr:redox-sensing transcriptional repressor Rex [Candidatus Poribacteria bacterium]
MAQHVNSDPTASPESKRVPGVTVERLSIYSRVLAVLEKEGRDTASSSLLAERTPFTAAQIRRDLTWFGQFGTRGKGYPIAELRQKLNEILGVNVPRRVALIGVGNLGSALLGYTGFGEHNFQIVAAFDAEPKKVGTKTPQGIPIYAMRDLLRVVNAAEIEIAILAVPVEAAQKALDAVIEAGIRAVLNFAPAPLNAAPPVRLRNVDLSIELEGLTYYLAHESES